MTRLSVILPTYNEAGSVVDLIHKLLALPENCLSFQDRNNQLEILVIDDDSNDGTVELVRQLSQQTPMVRLVRRVGRRGLASAIREGLLDATGEIAVVMDSDGQHEVGSVVSAVQALFADDLDLVIGSRFHPEARIHGLSARRERGSTWANRWASISLSRHYAHLTDLMSGFFVVRLKACEQLIRAVDVNGFKFLYELLALSNGCLRCAEVPLRFQPREHGVSKLDVAIFWDFAVSLLHQLCFRLLPRRAISFALVGATGVFVQLLMARLLLQGDFFRFEQVLPVAVLAAATSNYLINNALTFRFQRQRGLALLRGLLRFWLVASLPVLANIGIASAYFNFVNSDVVIAQLVGILVVFIWNYAASSRFVWNTP